MKQNLRVALTSVTLLLCALLSSGTSYGQDRQVTGKVTSTVDGAGIPGVNVQVQGTNTGTVTDADGRYGIDAKSANSVLVFSSIGYIKQEITVGSKTVIDVKLSDDIKSLTEVVVTGYASQRKQDITGAVTVINPKELTAVPSASVTQM